MPVTVLLPIKPVAKIHTTHPHTTGEFYKVPDDINHYELGNLWFVGQTIAPNGLWGVRFLHRSHLIM